MKTCSSCDTSKCCQSSTRTSGADGVATYCKVVSEPETTAQNNLLIERLRQEQSSKEDSN